MKSFAYQKAVQKLIEWTAIWTFMSMLMLVTGIGLSIKIARADTQVPVIAYIAAGLFFILGICAAGLTIIFALNWRQIRADWIVANGSLERWTVEGSR